LSCLELVRVVSHGLKSSVALHELSATGHFLFVSCSVAFAPVAPPRSGASVLSCRLWPLGGPRRPADAGQGLARLLRPSLLVRDLLSDPPLLSYARADRDLDHVLCQLPPRMAKDNQAELVARRRLGRWVLSERHVFYGQRAFLLSCHFVHPPQSHEKRVTMVTLEALFTQTLSCMAICKSLCKTHHRRHHRHRRISPSFGSQRSRNPTNSIPCLPLIFGNPRSSMVCRNVVYKTGCSFIASACLT